jgi:Fe-S-cluster containining protein
MPPDLAQSWLTALADPQIAAELESIYARAAAAIEARKPVCVSSGRCCHFDAYGHRLYVTGLEAAYTLSRSSPAALGGGGGGGEADAGGGRIPLPILTSDSLSAAHATGSCPFLDGTLCSVHTIKPLACRTFYCDPTAQEWQQELTERLLGQLRALHERHNIEYRYGEWRSMLGLFTRS